MRNGAEKVLEAVRRGSGRLELAGARISGGFRSPSHLVAAVVDLGFLFKLERRTLRLHSHPGVPPLPASLRAEVARTRLEIAALMRKPARERTPPEREGLELAETYGTAWLEAQGGGFRG